MWWKGSQWGIIQRRFCLAWFHKKKPFSLFLAHTKWSVWLQSSLVPDWWTIKGLIFIWFSPPRFFFCINILMYHSFRTELVMIWVFLDPKADTETGEGKRIYYKEQVRHWVAAGSHVAGCSRLSKAGEIMRLKVLEDRGWAACGCSTGARWLQKNTRKSGTKSCSDDFIKERTLNSSHR